MYEYHAKVLKVVDGDTLDIEIDIGFNISLKQRVRLNGIDTPESRTKNAEEKALGMKAKKLVAEAAKNATSIVVRTYKDDKYGRLLIDLIADGVNVNEMLIKEGLAWGYTGGTKNKDLTKLTE